MTKENKKQKRTKEFWKTCLAFLWKVIVAFSVLLAIYGYFYPPIIPKSPQLNVFYDPAKNTTYYGISNDGDAPLKNVKTNYQIECQNIKYENEYIRKEIPSLPPSLNTNSEYLHYFDNRTQNILRFSYENKNLCENGSMTKIGLNLSSWYFNQSNESFDIIFCDQCELKINVSSDIQKKSNNFTFINPIRARLNLESKIFPSSFCPPSNCGSILPCTRFEINWKMQDEWNTEPTSVDVLLSVDKDISPTKMFVMLNKSS